MLTNLGIGAGPETRVLRPTIARRSPFGGIRKRDYFPEFWFQGHSPDRTRMLQDPLYVPHTSGFSRLRKRVTKVRIPISPPHSLGCGGIGLHYCKNRSKSPQSCRSCSQTALEKVSRRTPKASFLALFSGGHTHSPVSLTPSGECNAFASRGCGESAMTS